MDWTRFSSIGLITIFVSVLVQHGAGEFQYARTDTLVNGTDYLDKYATIVRLERAAPVRNAGPGKGSISQKKPEDSPSSYEGTISLTVAPCQKEGIVLMQGKANYYIKCIWNDEAQDFYQLVYICRQNMRSIADAKKCIPPNSPAAPAQPDCSKCPSMNQKCNCPAPLPCGQQPGSNSARQPYGPSHDPRVHGMRPVEPGLFPSFANSSKGPDSSRPSRLPPPGNFQNGRVGPGVQPVQNQVGSPWAIQPSGQINPGGPPNSSRNPMAQNPFLNGANPEPKGNDQVANIGNMGNPNGNILNPNGNTGSPNGNMRIPSGNIGNSNGNIGTPSGNMGNPNGKNEGPQGNAGSPGANTGYPVGNTAVPAGNKGNPSRSLGNPNDNFGNPLGNSRNPIENSPGGNPDNLARNFGNPNGHIGAPGRNVNNPSGQAGSPVGNMRNPSPYPGNPNSNFGSHPVNVGYPTGNIGSPSANGGSLHKNHGKANENIGNRNRDDQRSGSNGNLSGNVGNANGNVQGQTATNGAQAAVQQGQSSQAQQGLVVAGYREAGEKVTKVDKLTNVNHQVDEQVHFDRQEEVQKFVKKTVTTKGGKKKNGTTKTSIEKIAGSGLQSNPISISPNSQNRPSSGNVPNGPGNGLGNHAMPQGYGGPSTQGQPQGSVMPGTGNLPQQQQRPFSLNEAGKPPMEMSVAGNSATPVSPPGRMPESPMGASTGLNPSSTQVHGLPNQQGPRLPNTQAHGLPNPQGPRLPNGHGPGVPNAQGQGIPSVQGQGQPNGQEQGMPNAQGQGVPKAQGQGQLNGKGQAVPNGPGQGIPKRQGIPNAQAQGVPYTRGQRIPVAQGQGIPNPPGSAIPITPSQGSPNAQGHGLPNAQEQRPPLYKPANPPPQQMMPANSYPKPLTTIPTSSNPTPGGSQRYPLGGPQSAGQPSQGGRPIAPLSTNNMGRKPPGQSQNVNPLLSARLPGNRTPTSQGRGGRLPGQGPQSNPNMPNGPAPSRSPNSEGLPRPLPQSRPMSIGARPVRPGYPTQPKQSGNKPLSNRGNPLQKQGSRPQHDSPSAGGSGPLSRPQPTGPKSSPSNGMNPAAPNGPSQNNGNMPIPPRLPQGPGQGSNPGPVSNTSPLQSRMNPQMALMTPGSRMEGGRDGAGVQRIGVQQEGQNQGKGQTQSSGSETEASSEEEEETIETEEIITVRTVRFRVRREFFEKLSYETSFTMTVNSRFSWSTIFVEYAALAAVPPSEATSEGPVASAELANRFRPKCSASGLLPLPDPSLYADCSNYPPVEVAIVHQCPSNSVFASGISRCIHLSLPGVLQDDLGYSLGRGTRDPAEVQGLPVTIPTSDFPGMQYSCSAFGYVPFGTDDRMYLDCKGVGTPGTLLTCPFGYFFSPTRLRCIIRREYEKRPEHRQGRVKGLPTSTASPLWVIAQCVKVGMFSYPDYRFYYTCELSPSGSFLPPKLFECPPGLFYNQIYRLCTKPSAFPKFNYDFSWRHIHTHHTISHAMDLRSGIGVQVGSIPFSFMMGDKPGKYASKDPRYYYISSPLPGGQMGVRLFVCHSGFFFSSRTGHCVPSYLQENVLATDSYKYGINLARGANLQLQGQHLIGQSKPAAMLISTPDIGPLSVIQNLRIVHGLMVDPATFYMDLAPCTTSGIFATPDYRFYYVCLRSRPEDEGDEDDDAEFDEDAPGSPNDDEDDEDEYHQKLYQCPPGLFFSASVGFCIASYFHSDVALAHWDKYTWDGNQLKVTDQMTSEGMAVAENIVPWIIPPCAGDSMFSLRDPRYYAKCHGGQRTLFICPTNTYFNPNTRSCKPITACDCWQAVGLPSNPTPAGGGGGIPGLDLEVQIILDRSYLQVLRKIIETLVARTSRSPLAHGKDSALIARLICFWRDMETQRTLRFPNKLPNNNATVDAFPMSKDFGFREM